MRQRKVHQLQQSRLLTLLSGWVCAELHEMRAGPPCWMTSYGDVGDSVECWRTNGKSSVGTD